jgi:hypothetical protein
MAPLEDTVGLLKQAGNTETWVSVTEGLTV